MMTSIISRWIENSKTMDDPRKLLGMSSPSTNEGMAISDIVLRVSKERGKRNGFKPG